ncbi:MAG TPA: histidine phosphatase family protein [Candidatus Saccharimonadales bacterium]|nr:histidine phosphatase family protein [Candidatus Saccharimonadales bacterium]
MLVYLVRHGQTTGDVQGRYGGDYDDHLTELGKRQSADAAKKLSVSAIEIIYCSPKIRAQETAGIIKEAINAPLVTVPGFRERNRYGALSGLTETEATQKYPDQVRMLNDEQKTIAGGEDYESFGQRIRDALKKIDTGEHQVVAIITHGGPIRYIFREFLKEDGIKIGDCAFVKLKLENGKFAVLELDGIKLNA